MTEARFVATTHRRASYYRPGVYLVWDRVRDRAYATCDTYGKARSAAAELNRIVKETR